MSHRVTIRDVAHRAGCGVATVSRVLNHSGPASDDVKSRVLAAATALGFEFSEMGRSLQSRRSRTLAIVVPSLRNDVFAMAIEGAQQAAAAGGYQVLLACVNYDREAEFEAVQTLVAKSVEGIVLTVADPNDSPAIGYLQARGVPHCLIFNQPSVSCPSVGVDNRAAARMVAEKLMDNGHEAVGFVALRFQSSERSRLRYEGLMQGFIEAGKPAPLLLEADDDRGLREGSLSTFVSDNPEMTAIFASNDLLALFCIRALTRLGRQVPDDISVVGFDGIDTGELVSPSLSTIITPSAEMGRLAALRLIKAIDAATGVTPENEYLPFHFRVGGSLGPRRTDI